MNVEFDVKYGKNVVEVPDSTKASLGQMADLWKAKVTIYNDIPATETDPRHFIRFVIDKCSVQGGFVEKLDNTIRNVVNAKTVITKDTEHYIKPYLYDKLSEYQKQDYYTVRPGDFVVFDEVFDLVTTAKEFADLQTKYKDNGIKVTYADANINGMAVDNITISNA